MATLTKQVLGVCEIDSQYPSQTNSASCDCGNYGSKVNNCFFNIDSINDEIPAGSAVSSAVLTLAQVSGGYSYSQNMQFTLRSGSWSAFSWNSQPADAGAGSVAVSLSGTSAGSRSFSVTSLVQWIVNNNSTAHIFKLQRVPNDTSGSDDAKRFSTSAGNHQLTVTYTAPTSPTAPTDVTLSKNPFESALSVNWVKGSNGVNNPITGQEVRYQTSANGTTWGSETVVSVSSTATSYAIPSATLNALTPGYYLRARVGSKSAYASTVYSGYSASARKNRQPNTLTNVSTSKAFYAPGEYVRINFINTGDADNNLDRVEADIDASGTAAGTNTAAATYVEVPTTGLTPGVSYSFRVRGVDALAVAGAWSAPVTAMVGLPMFVQPAADGAFKRVVSMQVYVSDEAGFKTVTGMKIAPVQGAINKTVF